MVDDDPYSGPCCDACTDDCTSCDDGVTMTAESPAQIADELTKTIKKAQAIATVATMWGLVFKRYPRTTLAVTALGIGTYVGWRYYTED